MNALSTLLDDFKKGLVSKQDVLERFSFHPTEPSYSPMGIAKIDDGRYGRIGIPEVVYGEKKTASDIIRIARHYREKKKNCLITRINPEKQKALQNALPGFHRSRRANVAWSIYEPMETSSFKVGIVCAGTSDVPVALEAALTLRFLGHRTAHFFDVGVSGLHRLLACQENIKACHLVICLAGMEAALPSVLASLTGRPIVCVPISSGYGVAQGGFSALFSMLSSCSPNVSCVNIDNGVGAACFCHSVLNSFHQEASLV